LFAGTCGFLCTLIISSLSLQTSSHERCIHAVQGRVSSRQPPSTGTPGSHM
jgi:hypothetical protein